MKSNDLAALKQQHEELGIAIRVLERLHAGNGRSKARRFAALAGSFQKHVNDGPPLTEAIIAALKAAKEPIELTHLGDLVRAAGVISAKSGQPVDNRGVAVTAAMMARRKKIKKSKQGYSAVA